MLRLCLAIAIAVLAPAVASTTSTAAESLPAPAPVAASDPVHLDAHQYFYVDFPRRLRALRDQIVLAEAELAFAYDRAESYRPFRSFGRYAATYTADRAAQLDALAAAQRLECLRTEETALWRERQLAALRWSQR